VKVCHPNVDYRIAMDFCCLKFIALMCRRFIPLIDVKEVADQFATSLSLQVDLRYEARNLTRFCTNFEHLQQILFPKPIMEMTTEKVMVESFVDAKPISELTKTSKHYTEGEVPVLNSKVVHIGLDAFMQMIITDNFFHADLHPGNVLYSVDSKTQLPQLCLVDAGIALTLTKEQRDNMFFFMQGIQAKDSEKVGRCVLAMGKGDSPFTDKEKYYRDMQELFNVMLPKRKFTIASWFRKVGIVSNTRPFQDHVACLIKGLFRIVRENHVSLDANYASLLFSSLMIESICNDVDPHFDTVKGSQRWFLSSPLQRIFGLQTRKSDSRY